MNTAASSHPRRKQLLSLLIVGFEGTSLPEQFHLALTQGLGGIILFARNYRDRAQLTALTESICRDRQDAIIAVDQEGGRVTRFAGDFPAFPAPGYFGTRSDLAGLLNTTRVTAQHLRQCGINCNLVPVCDLQPTQRGHVVYDRSYSSDPHECAEAVAAQVSILREFNLLSCAKHFPGLASATGDPHLLISRSERKLSEFRQRDFTVFASAISARCDLVMPTHLLAPDLDSDNIATFSRKLITEELRGNLHFDGLVISDDLQMLGALEGTDPAGAAIKSLSAGCDLLIYGNLSGGLDALVDEVVRRIDTDDTLSRMLDDRCRRVETFRQSSPALQGQ